MENDWSWSKNNYFNCDYTFDGLDVMIQSNTQQFKKMVCILKYDYMLTSLHGKGYFKKERKHNITIKLEGYETKLYIESCFKKFYQIEIKIFDFFGPGKNYIFNIGDIENEDELFEEEICNVIKYYIKYHGHFYQDTYKKLF